MRRQHAPNVASYAAGRHALQCAAQRHRSAATGSARRCGLNDLLRLGAGLRHAHAGQEILHCIGRQRVGRAKQTIDARDNRIAYSLRQEASGEASGGTWYGANACEWCAQRGACGSGRGRQREPANYGAAYACGSGARRLRLRNLRSKLSR